MQRIGRSGLVIISVLIALALIGGGVWVTFAARTLAPFRSTVYVEAGKGAIPLGSLAIAKLPVGNGSGGFTLLNSGKAPEWVQLTTREVYSGTQAPLVFSYEVELYHASTLLTTSAYRNPVPGADGLPSVVLYVATQSARDFQIGTPWTLHASPAPQSNTVFLPAGYHATIEYAWTKSAPAQGELSMTVLGLPAAHHTRVGKDGVGVGPQE